jgi:hypothetical protein
MRWILLFLVSVAYCSDEKIFFLHIPKSGGVTFRSILMDHFEEGTYLDNVHYTEPLPFLQDYCLISGHLLYSQINKDVFDFLKVTFLREPISRVLSEQFYITERDHEEKLAQVLQEHFLPRLGNPIDTAENVSCKFLSKLDPLNPLITIEEHLLSAKESLTNDFDFLGITERMEESIQLFHDLVGWKRAPWIPVHNVTPRNQIYSQEILQAIARRNWADIELYQYALELFEKQKSSINPLLKEREIEWISCVDYHFQSPLDGWGWCPRERWSEGVFRWLCSSERGMITFPLKAGCSYMLTTRVYIPVFLLSRFILKVNGILVSYLPRRLTFSQDEYSWFLLKAVLPRELIQSGKKTEIEFVIDDPSRLPAIDSYRGRCGSNLIRIEEK